MQNSKLYVAFLSKHLFTLCSCLFALCSLLAPLSAVAQNEAEEYLARLSEAVRSEARALRFTAEGDGMQFEGVCTLSGDRYRVELDGVAVEGDRTMRAEIDHRRKTVTLLPVDAESRQLLDNPIRAFDFSDMSDRAKLLLATDSEVVVEWCEPTAPPTTIRLTMDPRTALPRKVRYEMEGIALEIVIRAIEPIAPLAPFVPTDYVGYEVVDFR